MRVAGWKRNERVDRGHPGGFGDIAKMDCRDKPGNDDGGVDRGTGNDDGGAGVDRGTVKDDGGG